jgi:aryl-alcohol dehydrogenase-like predicted oxidoreductase
MIEQPIIVKRPLGKTGIQITPIGLGMMEFAGGGGFIGYAFPVIPQETKNEIVKAALDGGINWFDTAEMYGLGVSEQSTADALKAAGKTRADVVIATKWLPFLRTARNIPHSIDDRLRFLDGFNIDLYMIHQPWSFSSPEAEMDAMAGLVQAGKIRSVGVSNFNPERMRRAYAQLQKHGLPLAVNQVRYSLLDRSIETNGILDTARELGVTIIAYTPLGSGLLSGKYHRDPSLVARLPRYRRSGMQSKIEATRPLVSALEEIAAKHQVNGQPATAAQVALNWVIHVHGETIVTIPGATKIHQARDNAGAMHFQITPDEIARLDELSRGNR